MGCESQTKQLVGSISRSNSHCRRVFILFYHRCRYLTRGYRDWQRSRFLCNESRETPDLQSVTICHRVCTTCRSQLGLSLTTNCPFARWDQFALTIALNLQSVNFWGGSFAQSSHSTGGFSPQAIFETGITLAPPGSLISTYVYFLTQTRCALMLIDSFVA